MSQFAADWRQRRRSAASPRDSAWLAIEAHHFGGQLGELIEDDFDGRYWPAARNVATCMTQAPVVFCVAVAL
jgi:hypothetical protein